MPYLVEISVSTKLESTIKRKKIRPSVLISTNNDKILVKIGLKSVLSPRGKGHSIILESLLQTN